MKLLRRNGIEVDLDQAQDWDHIAVEDRKTGEVMHRLTIETEDSKAQWLIPDARKDRKGAAELEAAWFYCEERYEKLRAIKKT